MSKQWSGRCPECEEGEVPRAGHEAEGSSVVTGGEEAARTDDGIDEIPAVYLKDRQGAIRIDLEELGVEIAALILLYMVEKKGLVN